MASSKVAAYRREEMAGKSPLELVIQVYDGAISAFRAAADRYRSDDAAGGREQLERAQTFVTHLYTTLDAERGGDISAQLGRLYAYVINRISVAAATGDPGVIDDNIAILNNLREGWIGLRAQSADPAPRGPAPAAAPGGFVGSA